MNEICTGIDGKYAGCVTAGMGHYVHGCYFYRNESHGVNAIHLYRYSRISIGIALLGSRSTVHGYKL